MYNRIFTFIRCLRCLRIYVYVVTLAVICSILSLLPSSRFQQCRYNSFLTVYTIRRYTYNYTNTLQTNEVSKLMEKQYVQAGKLKKKNMK